MPANACLNHRKTLTLALALAVSPLAADEFSPFLERQGMEQLLWGDTHLHTAFSSDSGLIGNKLQPADAYRFARGEEVVSTTGVRARINRPLDFLVISDHAESLGLPIAVAEANPTLLANPCVPGVRGAD